MIKPNLITRMLHKNVTSAPSGGSAMLTSRKSQSMCWEGDSQASIALRSRHWRYWRLMTWDIKSTSEPSSSNPFNYFKSLTTSLNINYIGSFGFKCKSRAVSVNEPTNCVANIIVLDTLLIILYSWNYFSSYGGHVLQFPVQSGWFLKWNPLASLMHNKAALSSRPQNFLQS